MFRRIIAGSADLPAASLADVLRSAPATALPHRGRGPFAGRPRAARPDGTAEGDRGRG